VNMVLYWIEIAVNSIVVVAGNVLAGASEEAATAQAAHDVLVAFLVRRSAEVGEQVLSNIVLNSIMQ